MDHWSREDSVDTIVILSGSETVPKKLLLIIISKKKNTNWFGQDLWVFDEETLVNLKKGLKWELVKFIMPVCVVS